MPNKPLATFPQVTSPQWREFIALLFPNFGKNMSKEEAQLRPFIERVAVLEEEIAELQELLRAMLNYGPLSLDSWEDSWRERVKQVLN